jgi:hypothetical protein
MSESIARIDPRNSPSRIKTHRIDLRPDLRPDDGTGRPRMHGKTPMLYNGEVIGSSDQPEYDAARILLAKGAPMPEDKLETCRGEMLCMSGVVGKLAKWTVEETKNGNPTFKLRPWKAFEIAEGRSPAAEMPEATLV